MAYIYQIQNDINGKIYVGKTEFSIDKRFQEHCRDSRKETKEKRPLYAAMRKYGIEHFHISLIEETSNPEEREKYWIEKLGTFKNGYNATVGGDGRSYIDYALVCSLYEQEQNQARVADLMGISVHSVKSILDENNITTLSAGQSIVKRNSKTVALLDNDNQIYLVFDNSLKAAEYVKNQDNLCAEISTIASHIRAVCQGKRISAYKRHWRFI